MRGQLKEGLENEAMSLENQGTRRLLYSSGSAEAIEIDKSPGATAGVATPVPRFNFAWPAAGDNLIAVKPTGAGDSGK